MGSYRNWAFSTVSEATEPASETIVSISDHFEVATALVDARQNIVHVNAAFRRRAERPGVELRQGHLWFAASEAQAELRRACERLSAGDSDIYAVVPVDQSMPIREIAEIRTVEWEGARRVMIWLIDLHREHRGVERIGRASGLTEREQVVLGLIAKGQDASEIARSLGVALSTTRTHIQRILYKMGVDSQQKALRMVCGAALP